MFSSTVFVALMALVPSLASAGPLQKKAGVMQTIDNAHATVYYDLTGQLCGDASKGDPFTPNWGETSGINKGVPFCQLSDAKSLDDLGTNRIVALRRDWVIGDPSKYCGKEVQVIQENGQPLVFDEGPLFIWDGCEACVSAPIIDMSAKAFTQLKGGSCAGNNPGGLTVQIMDNNIWELGHGGAGAAPAAASSSSPASNATAPALQGKAVVNAAAVTNAAPAAASSDSQGPSITSAIPPVPTSNTQNCTFGEWQCDGLALQVCSYQGVTELNWETVETCSKTCNVSGSSNVECQ